jgi:hypothetical protein
MGKRLELVGRKFGRLLVISDMGTNKKLKSLWGCLCECGNNLIVMGSDLINGNTKSCGCLQREATSKAKTKHGQTRFLKVSRAYSCWSEMKQRCLNPNNSQYKDYGGRGIIVCKRWLEKETGFANFLSDMGNPPDMMTIERLDNNGSYSPDNCKWATRKEQGNNKRNNRFLSHEGETRTLSQWADYIGINQDTLGCRLNSYHWSIEKTLSTPLRVAGQTR